MCALVTGVQTCALPILVECTPCLLCVDEVATNLPRVGDRLADRTRGDFGKHHPMQHLAIEQTALTQDLDDMPGNGLALAIRVSGQVQCLGTLGGLGDGIDMLDRKSTPLNSSH